MKAKVKTVYAGCITDSPTLGLVLWAAALQQILNKGQKTIFTFIELLFFETEESQTTSLMWQ